jgi:phage terminase large subunit GpA-like protein
LDYAEEHFYVTGGETTMRWITRPYQRDWFLAVSDPNVQCIVCKKPARIGWSEFVKFVIQWFVDWKRKKILVVHPTASDSEMFVSEHIDEGLFHPLKAPPRLRDLFDYSGSKKALPNNKDLKVAKNGALVQFVNAGSPSSARGVNRPVVLMEEVSGWYEINEGSALENYKRRADTSVSPFYTIGATPVHVGDHIEVAFLMGDQQYRYYPCPHCGNYDELMTRDAWKRFITEGEHAGKKRCSHCEELIEYKHLRWMDENAGWACPLGLDRTNQVLDDEGQPIWRSQQHGPGQSYHTGQKWTNIAREHRIAKEELRKGRPERMMSFHMTMKGVAWEPAFAAQITATGLAKRQLDEQAGNNYPPEDSVWEAPRGVLAVTIGVDTQGGGGGTIGEGFAVHVWGWGAGWESWHLAQYEISGDPRQTSTLDQLDAIMAAVWHREDGARLTAMMGGVDEGGHATEEVRRWCDARIGKWAPVRGISKENYPILSKGTPVDFDAKNKPKGKVGKDTLMYGVGYEASVNLWAAQLEVKSPGPGYVHLGRAANEQTLNELFPWKRALRSARSTRASWVLPAGSRDEAGDCRRYAYAALGLITRRYALERKALETIDSGGDKKELDILSVLRFG